MANKRDLKKQIKNICGALASECALASQFVPGIDREKMNEIIGKIADLQVTTIERLGVAFDKSQRDFDNQVAYVKAKKEYFAKAYKALVEGFNKQAEEIVGEMNAVLPQAQKDANKEAAAKA